MKPFKLYTATILASVMFYAGTEIQALEAKPNTDPGKGPENNAANPTKQKEEDPTLAEAKAELQRRADAEQLAEASQSVDESEVETAQIESSVAEASENDSIAKTELAVAEQAVTETDVHTIAETAEQSVPETDEQAATETAEQAATETAEQAVPETAAQSEVDADTSSEQLEDVELPENAKHYPDRAANPGKILDESEVEGTAVDALSQDNGEKLLPVDTVDSTTSSTTADDSASIETNTVADAPEAGDAVVETPAAEESTSQSVRLETQAVTTTPVMSSPGPVESVASDKVEVETQSDSYSYSSDDRTNELGSSSQPQSENANSYSQGAVTTDTTNAYSQPNTLQVQNNSEVTGDTTSKIEEDVIVNIESRDDDGIVYDLDLLTGQDLLDRLIYDESTPGNGNGERSLKEGWNFDEKTKTWRYAQKNGYLKGGVYTIGENRFVFDDQGRLANNQWLKFVQDGILRYALAKPVQSSSSVPMTSNVYAAELFTSDNGITYGFTANGYLGYNQWIQLKSDKSLVFANGQSGIIIKDGVAQIDHELYAFDKNGRLVQNSWAQVNKGQDYVLAKPIEFKPNSIKPLKSNLYQQEVYQDTRTKKKYVFNARGYIAKNQWVQLKNGVFVFGQGNNGAPLSNGVYKIKNKIYAFNNQGTLANNTLLIYGKHRVRAKVVKSSKGIPESNTFANTVILDGQKKHLINANGFIAQNQWVRLQNGEFAFGSGVDGNPLAAGVYKINNELYAFNKNGKLAKNVWLAMAGGRKVLTTDIRTDKNRPVGGNVRHAEIYKDARTNKQHLFNAKGFLARNEWVKKRDGRYSYGSGDLGTPVKDGIYRFGKDEYFAFTPSGDLANNEYVNFSNGAKTFAKPVRLANNKPVGGNVYRDGRYRINGELKQFTKGGYLVNATGNFVAGPTISVTQQQYMAYERCEKEGRLYLAGSDGRVITTSLNVNGRIIPIDKYDGHVIFNDGWQHVSGKEYYFFSDTSIAKPYEKVGDAYVNGSYGSRINAKAKGIDISEHQGYIDFDAVKKDGIDFVFIRSGYATSTDQRFFENIREAKRVGLKVGVYVYSYASTPEQAREEARYAASLLRGQKLDLPLVYDIEDPQIESAVPSRKGRSDLIRAFCNEVKSQGYKSMVYTNPSWLNDKLEYSIRHEYDIWLAHWADKPRYQTEFWQASEKGQVNGIRTNVDIDFMFTDLHRYL